MSYTNRSGLIVLRTKIVFVSGQTKIRFNAIRLGELVHLVAGASNKDSFSFGSDEDTM